MFITIKIHDGKMVEEWKSYQKDSIVKHHAFGVPKRIVNLEDIAIEENGEKYVKFEVGDRIYKFHLAKDETNRVSGMGVIGDYFKDANYVICEWNGNDIIRISPDIKTEDTSREESFIDFIFETAEKYDIPLKNLRRKIPLLKRLKMLEKQEKDILKEREGIVEKLKL